MEQVTRRDEPWPLWKRWMEQASSDRTFFLGTVGLDGTPHMTCVYLLDWKGEEEGFKGELGFICEKDSVAAKQMEENPKIGACFRWVVLNRQARIRGHSQKLTDEETEKLCQKPSKEKDHQTQVKRINHKEIQGDNNKIGYRIIVSSIEFFSERNERTQYSRSLDDSSKSHPNHSSSWEIEYICA